MYTIIFEVLLLMIVLLLGFVFWIHTSHTSLQEADVLIILGFKTEGNVPHPLLQERLSTALYAIKHVSFKKIICSGGVVGGQYPEARIIKQYLMRFGINEKDILIEEKSTDTIENLAFSSEIMNKYNLQSALIVSNSFHIRRIQMICNHLGINAHCYTTRKWNDIKKQIPNTLNEAKAFALTIKKLRKGYMPQ